jgi:replicative DNA helicase
MLMMDVGLFNQQAEEAVVGSLFLKEELVKECTVLPEELYLEPLQNLLSVIMRLDEKGKPIDVISVLEEVGE